MKKSFKIYQLPVAHEAKFCNFEFVTEHNLLPKLSDYEKVYEGEVEVPEGKDSETVCDHIYMKFQGAKPEGYTGHSISMSDVIEIDGKFYYCDEYSWEEVTFPTDEAHEGKMFYVTYKDKFDNEFTVRIPAEDGTDAQMKVYAKPNVADVIQVVEEVSENDDTASLTTKTETTMKETSKKVAMTAEEKVFNLCVESAKQSKSGYNFNLKDVWTAARKKYKLAKQDVIDAMDAIAREHEIKKVGEGPSVLFTLVELMPKEEKKQPKHVLTECEIINLKAQKLARQLFGEKFTRFSFTRFDATSEKEYKNADEAIRAKADMNNLLYVVNVVEGVEFMAKTRVAAYQKFLDEFEEKVA